MRGGFPRYFQCPYCLPFDKGYGIKGRVKGEKVPKTVGKFRIMELNEVMLILRCEKCRRSIKIKYFGYVLAEDDITPMDLESFNKLAKQEVKNYGSSNKLEKRRGED